MPYYQDTFLYYQSPGYFSLLSGDFNNKVQFVKDSQKGQSLTPSVELLHLQIILFQALYSPCCAISTTTGCSGMVDGKDNSVNTAAMLGLVLCLLWSFKSVELDGFCLDSKGKGS